MERAIKGRAKAGLLKRAPRLGVHDLYWGGEGALVGSLTVRLWRRERIRRLMNDSLCCIMLDSTHFAVHPGNLP